MKFLKFFLLGFLLSLIGCQKDKIGDENTLSTIEEKKMISYIKDESNYRKEFGANFKKVESKYQERVNGISVGIGLFYENGGSYLLNLTYSKKNNVYTKDVINFSDMTDFTTYSTSKFENLFYSSTLDKNDLVSKNQLSQLAKKLDFNEMIEEEVNPNCIILKYFDEETQTSDIESGKFRTPQDYRYNTFIEKTSNGYTALNRDEIIGTYPDLDSLFKDKRINPLPIRVLSKLKFGGKSTASVSKNQGPWIEFFDESKTGLITKKSEVFYKIEVWNNLEKKGKPYLVYDNGIIKTDENGKDQFIFDSADSVITFDYGGTQEVTSNLDIHSKDGNTSNYYGEFNTHRMDGNIESFNPSNQLDDRELCFIKDFIPDYIKKEIPYLKNLNIKYSFTRYEVVTTISGYNENKKEIHKLIISKTNNNYFSKLIKYYKSKNEEVLKKGNIDMYSLFN